MAYYPAHCDNICEGCDMNRNGWCIAFDKATTFAATESANMQSQSNNPCEYCFNNPKNNPNASGICHCVLPCLHNSTY